MKTKEYSITQEIKDIIQNDDKDFHLKLRAEVNTAKKVDEVLIEFSDESITFQLSLDLSKEDNDIYFKNTENVFKDLIEAARKRLKSDASKLKSEKKQYSENE